MHVGYKLVRVSDQAVIQTWGGEWGTTVDFPNPIILPNGLQICAGLPNVEYDGYVVEELHAGPAARHVKVEAQRRIIAAVGATSFEGCITKQLNANMRATELTLKRAAGEEWTEDEEAEAAALQALAATIKSIRLKSNDIEAMDQIPNNFMNDENWQ